MDLVESVRHMETDEIGTISRWREFLKYTNAAVIPKHQGRLVKETGDGFVAEFGTSMQAVSAALSLQRFFDRVNNKVPPDEGLFFRAGVHNTHLYRGKSDIYGSGVNLAARIASLARPGETVITEKVKDDLLDGTAFNIEDMGESFLKHVSGAVRTFKVDTSRDFPAVKLQPAYQPPLDPRIAVIPFETRSKLPLHCDVGDLIADGVITRLGRSTGLRVLAKLSTTRLRGESIDGESTRQLLQCDYSLTGSFIICGSGENPEVLINVALTACANNEIVWTERLKIRLQDLLELNSEACGQIAEGTHQYLLNAAAKKAFIQPMPTIESYSLLLSGISLMHRSNAADMKLSRELLGHLTERHPSSGDAFAWLAKSYILNAVSNTQQIGVDAQQALSICKSGLLRNSESSLSLAVLAHLNTHLDQNTEKASEQIQMALAINPNEPLAWLFKSVLSAMWGDASLAVQESRRANELSPLDPLAYYFKMIAASAYTANGDFSNATALAHESIRLNRLHTPTWRVLITAHCMGGNVIGAKDAFNELLKLDPSFSVERYQAAGNAQSRTKQQFIAACRSLSI
jgi:adenylate cyclase